METTFTTVQDAIDQLTIILGEQPGDYDVQAIAEKVIVPAEPTPTGGYRLRLTTEEEGFWDDVIAGAITE